MDLLTCNLFAETAMSTDVVAQITTGEVVHDEVEIVAVLERIVHVHEERVLQLRQDLTLVDDGLDAALGDDASLAHFLHCEELLGFLALHTPHFSEAAFANAIVVDEILFMHSW